MAIPSISFDLLNTGCLCDGAELSAAASQNLERCVSKATPREVFVAHFSRRELADYACDNESSESTTGILIALKRARIHSPPRAQSQRNSPAYPIAHWRPKPLQQRTVVRGSICRNGPSSWELWTFKGDFEVSASHGSEIWSPLALHLCRLGPCRPNALRTGKIHININNLKTSCLDKTEFPLKAIRNQTWPVQVVYVYADLSCPSSATQWIEGADGGWAAAMADRRSKTWEIRRREQSIWGVYLAGRDYCRLAQNTLNYLKLVSTTTTTKIMSM